MKIKKITRSGIFLALAIILPQVFHLTGIPQSGKVFLPMHIPVMMSGIVLGPFYGFVIGVLAPILSSLITGMPDLARLPFMIGELSFYGLVMGYTIHNLKVYERPFGIIYSLIISMISGRLIYGIMILLADYIFKTNIGIIAVGHSIIIGAIGIIMQLVIIPTFIYLVKKWGMFNEFSR